MTASPPIMRTARLALAAAALTAVTSCVAQTGTSPDWPTSPDFARDALVPSGLPGSTYNGWTDAGGSWITDAGPGWDELWQLIYERGDDATIVIVTPETYTDDGSVETWRVRTTLLMDRDTHKPMDWYSCREINGPIRPVYARWSLDDTPTDIWLFQPQEGRFVQMPANEIVCEDMNPE